MPKKKEASFVGAIHNWLDAIKNEFTAIYHDTAIRAISPGRKKRKYKKRTKK